MSLATCLGIRRYKRYAPLAAMLLSLAGCSTQPAYSPPTAPATSAASQPSGKTAPAVKAPSAAYLPPAVAAQVPNAVPKPEPRSRRGNPSRYTVLGHTYKVRASSVGFTQTGYASWYGKKFQGKLTSSGEPFDMYKMTAAHKTLPIPTYLKVTNLRNHKSCVVRVNDRGPFRKDRIIDLSYAAAAKLGIIHHGTSKVRLQAIEPALPSSPTTPPVLSAANAHGTAASSAQAKLTAVADRHRYLQVGVFLHHDNAAALRDRLEASGISHLRLVDTRFEGKPAVRVVIGPFTAPQGLHKMRARLTLNGFPSEPVVN